jgi:tRNA pseudouridine13 synthase
MPAPPDYPIPNWIRANNYPLIQGVVKQSPGDFEVTERLGFRPVGNGEHDFLWVEKTGANTAWVAQQLARHAGVRELDVGYAGLKDRNAVTRQWFSVRRPSAAGTSWQAFAQTGVKILAVERHDKKLRRGAHEANHFRLAIRGIQVDRTTIGNLAEPIMRRGVPNYFGMQRFGQQGRNMQLARALFSGQRLPRNKRSIAISAARSFLYNHILQSRVRDNCWDRALPGEAFNLDDSNSIFVAGEITDELQTRLAEHDIHPTAALWGAGAPACTGACAALEMAIVAEFTLLSTALASLGVKQARRATRLTVQDFSWELDDTTLRLEFALPSGGYATTVLREIFLDQSGGTEA